MKSPEQIIAELDIIYDAGWRGTHIFSLTTILSETSNT
jgi:hypothetical protein